MYLRRVNNLNTALRKKTFLVKPNIPGRHLFCLPIYNIVVQQHLKINIKLYFLSEMKIQNILFNNIHYFLY